MFAYCNNNPILAIDPSGNIPILGIAAIGVAVIGLVNNLVNLVYYEHMPDGESDLTPDSYKDEDVSRWDKLDYTKEQTGEDDYTLNTWRYYNEYTIHQYGWYISGWAYEKDVPVFSFLAEKTVSAAVSASDWDNRWYVNVATAICGLLGF